MPRLGHKLGSAHVYTMRELSQRTSDVIREINESGEPAAVTLRGRFVAMITPLVGRDIEAAAAAKALESAGDPAALLGRTEIGQVRTVDELADELDVTLSPEH